MAAASAIPLVGVPAATDASLQTVVQTVSEPAIQSFQQAPTVVTTQTAHEQMPRTVTARERELAAAEPYDVSMGLPGHQNKAAVALAARPLGHWRRIWLPLLSIMFIVLVGVSMFQLYVYVTSHQSPNLQPIPANLAKRHERIGDKPKSWLSKHERQARQDLKMVFLLVDALGWAFVNGTNVVDATSQMGAIVNNPAYSKDAKLFKVHVQLPSMSLPNWYTDWIGVAPEMHGITGNFDLPPTKLETIVQSFASQNRTVTIIGDPQWGEMLPKPLPKGVVDNTTPLYYDDYCSNDQHGCMVSWDQEQFAKTMAELKKPRAERPDLLFTYFANVDAEGHSWGAASPQYASAVNNTVGFVRNFLEEMDDDTVFVMTADHGQVGVGGHGGLNGLILQAPVWIYRKNSGFSSCGYPANVSQFYAPAQTQLGAQVVGPLPGTPSTIDTAGTLAAIMGVPVPQESFGRFYRDALAVASCQNGQLAPDALETLAWKTYGLAAQKQKILQSYAAQVGRTSQVQSILNQPLAPFVKRQVQDWQAQVDSYTKSVNAYTDGLVSVRDSVANGNQTNNLAGSLCIFFLLWLPAICLGLYWVWDEVKWFPWKSKSGTVHLDANGKPVYRVRPYGQREFWMAGLGGFLAGAACVAIGCVVWRIVYIWYRNPYPDQWSWDMTLFNSFTEAFHLGYMLVIPALIISAIAIALGWCLLKWQGNVDPKLTYWYMSLGCAVVQVACGGLLVANYYTGLILPMGSGYSGYIDSTTSANTFHCFTISAALLPMMLVWGIAQMVAAGLADKGCLCGPAKIRSADSVDAFANVELQSVQPVVSQV